MILISIGMLMKRQKKKKVEKAENDEEKVDKATIVEESEKL